MRKNLSSDRMKWNQKDSHYCDVIEKIKDQLTVILEIEKTQEKIERDDGLILIEDLLRERTKRTEKEHKGYEIKTPQPKSEQQTETRKESEYEF